METLAASLAKAETNFVAVLAQRRHPPVAAPPLIEPVESVGGCGGLAPPGRSLWRRSRRSQAVSNGRTNGSDGAPVRTRKLPVAPVEPIAAVHLWHGRA